MNDKIEEIRARHTSDTWRRYELKAQIHDDRAFLLAEDERHRAEIKRLRADRRERIATAALQGLLSDPNRLGTFSDAVRISVEYADALIAKLDKEDGKP